jgi:hypothetical protein
MFHISFYIYLLDWLIGGQHLPLLIHHMVLRVNLGATRLRLFNSVQLKSIEHAYDNPNTHSDYSSYMYSICYWVLFEISYFDEYE